MSLVTDDMIVHSRAGGHGDAKYWMGRHTNLQRDLQKAIRAIRMLEAELSNRNLPLLKWED